MDLKAATDVSEIVKNALQALGFLALGAGIVKWLAQRRDRGADILLKLEDRFDQPEIAAGRRFLDKHDKKTPFSDAEMVTLEPLLRFYATLHSLHRARQIGSVSLLDSYRYWLGTARPENKRYNPAFRNFIDEYYPALSEWLATDRGFIGS
jgi:hypothetical protein